MFAPDDNNRLLFCGLHLEKGVSPSVAAAYPTGKRLVMGDDWAWVNLTLGIQLEMASLELI